MKEEFSLDFDAGLLNQLEEYARLNDMSVHEVLKLAVREMFANNGFIKPKMNKRL